MLRLYNLGKFIRMKYGFLDHNKYMPDKAEVQSSSSDRCVMSTQALLAGLYPPAPEDAFTQDLKWLPIPVHYVSGNYDKVRLGLFLNLFSY